MRPMICVTALTLFLAFWISSGARAENFVEVFANASKQQFVEVDVDSIRKGDDGFIYFTELSDLGRFVYAVDCGQRISYMVEMPDFEWKKPDWKSDGRKIEQPGGIGAMVADFVCARAR